MKTCILRNISFGSMALLMLILAATTILEECYGTQFTINKIYHSQWLITLWVLIVLSAISYILCISKRKVLILHHLSLITILLGAFISFLTSQRGEISLPKSSIPASMFTTTDGMLEKLPFRIQLEKCDTCYSKKGEQITTYTTHLKTSDIGKAEKTFTVSLNNPARIEGYTLCIKGISERDVTLLVSYDPFGKPICFSGYLMTIISFIMLFFDKKSGFNSTLAKFQYRITYKTFLISVCILILVISRISAFTGSDSQPILHTPLLTIHVSTIIIAYSLIGCAAFNSIAALTNMKNLEKRVISGRLLLYPATILLTTGIFIGAVWAEISWGRYWGWDPKETWALITLLACSITFHTRSLPFMAKPIFFHIYCIAIFIIMLFTYFGVNFMLSGLHSYA